MGRCRKFLLARVRLPVYHVYVLALANLLNSGIWGSWNGHEACAVITATTQPTQLHHKDRSWHGCTIAALAMGDFKSRKHIFEPIIPMNVNQVSACNTYRGLQDGETVPQYVERLSQELEAELQRVGPETVCAFVIEPIVGSVGKFSTNYCNKILNTKYGSCSRLRTSRWRVLWAHEGCMRPLWRAFDIWRSRVWIGENWHTTCLGGWRSCSWHRSHRESLGSGCVPISAVLVTESVVSALQGGSKCFKHGQTYQSHPLACAAALEVQRIVQDQNLVENVRRMGSYLETLLRERLADHAYVGDNPRSWSLFGPSS